MPRSLTVKPRTRKPVKQSFTPFRANRPTKPLSGAQGKPGSAGAKPGLGAAPRPAAKPKPRQAQKPTFDAPYFNEVDLATRRGSQRLSELGEQEQRTKFEFGIDDPTNPMSRAEGMKKAFLAKRKAASAGLASQGQLYSGAHERALSRTRREEEQERAELRSAYEASLAGIQGQQKETEFATEEAKLQAFEDWLARAEGADVDLGAEATTAPAPASGTPYHQRVSELIPRGAPGSPSVTPEYSRRAKGGATDYGGIGKAVTARGPKSLAQRRGNKRPGALKPIKAKGREQKVRKALMSHGKQWSQRQRLMRELKQLRAKKRR